MAESIEGVRMEASLGRKAAQKWLQSDGGS